MGLLFRHALLPALAPTSILGLYLTPVSVFGCVNRGLMAVGVALVAALGAAVTMALGARARARRDPAADRWLLTSLILLTAIALLIGLG